MALPRGRALLRRVWWSSCSKLTKNASAPLTTLSPFHRCRDHYYCHLHSSPFCSCDPSLSHQRRHKTFVVAAVAPIFIWSLSIPVFVLLSSNFWPPFFISFERQKSLLNVLLGYRMAAAASSCLFFFDFRGNIFFSPFLCCCRM